MNTEKYIDKNKKSMPDLIRYAHVYETCAVNNDQILYESSAGKGMEGDPYAIFKELLGREGSSHLEHIWVLDDPAAYTSVTATYKDSPYVHFVRYGSEEYLYALAEAKYLVNDCAFPFYYIKKPGQIYINTGCSISLQHRGQGAFSEIIGVANIMRNFLCADYLTRGNKERIKEYLEDYYQQKFMPEVAFEECCIQENTKTIEYIVHIICNECKGAGNLNFNRQEIAEIAGEQFFIQNVQVRCMNLLNARLIPVPPVDTVNFIFMGKVDSEDSLLALVCAFVGFHQEYPDTCLYILGGSPLLEKAEQKVRDLRLEEDIFFTGNVDDPSVIIGRCQYLVMTSEYSKNCFSEFFYASIQEIC